MKKENPWFTIVVQYYHLGALSTLRICNCSAKQVHAFRNICFQIGVRVTYSTDHFGIIPPANIETVEVFRQEQWFDNDTLQLTGWQSVNNIS